MDGAVDNLERLLFELSESSALYRELFQAVKQLADSGAPVYKVDEAGNRFCAYCKHVIVDSDFGESVYDSHAEDCPWRHLMEIAFLVY